MKQYEYASGNIVNEVCDVLLSGAPLTARMQQRSFAALRDIRDRDGVAVANDYRVKLRSAALTWIAMRMSSGKPTRRAGSDASAAPRGGAPATAEQLRLMTERFRRDMRARGIRFYD